MPYDVAQLLEMSNAELDSLFSRSPAGDIPDGPAKGTAIIEPGFYLGGVYCAKKPLIHFCLQFGAAAQAQG